MSDVGQLDTDRSLRECLLQLLETRTSEYGRGLTVDEIRDEFKEMYGEPFPEENRPLPSFLGDLRDRGPLEISGGFFGNSLYAPSDSGLKGVHKKDDHRYMIWQALQDAYDHHGRPTSTREIRSVLKQNFPEWEPSNRAELRSTLKLFTRSRDRGYEEFREPLAQLVQRETHVGKNYNYWAPADVDVGQEIVLPPASKADATREAIQNSHAAVRRPVSRAELRRWFKWGHVASVVREKVDPERVGTRLTDTLKGDRKKRGESGRIHCVETQFTAYGGCPRRYRLGPATDRERAICRTTDALHLARLDKERRQLSALEHTVQRFEALSPLLEARHDLVRQFVHRQTEGFSVQEILGEIEGTTRMLLGWLNDDERTRQDKQIWEPPYRRLLQGVRVAQMWEEGASLRRDGLPDWIGQAGVIGKRSVAPLLEQMADYLSLSEGQTRDRLKDVRRFPKTDTPGKERFGETGDHPLSVFDRPDAVRIVFEALPVPTASTLIAGARLILGEVLRDPTPLREALGKLADGQSSPRQQLVVALGLLGERVPAEKAIPDGASHKDATAWVLGTVLADWENAQEVIDKADRNISGPAQQVTSTALTRMEQGMFVSVVG